MASLPKHKVDDDLPAPQMSTTPVPDPTVLTTQNLRREIAGLRELIETRLDGMDQAIALAGIRSDEGREGVSTKIFALRELHEEKFSSIQTQFAERDTRGEQTAKDSKVAVDAALQAAKEAVGEQNKSSALAIAKSEAATMKQIDQIGVTIAALSKSLDDKIIDLKDRVALIEGHSKGAGDLWGFITGAIGLGISLIAIALALLKGPG